MCMYICIFIYIYTYLNLYIYLNLQKIYMSWYARAYSNHPINSHQFQHVSPMIHVLGGQQYSSPPERYNDDASDLRPRTAEGRDRPLKLWRRSMAGAAGVGPFKLGVKQLKRGMLFERIVFLARLQPWMGTYCLRCPQPLGTVKNLEVEYTRIYQPFSKMSYVQPYFGAWNHQQIARVIRSSSKGREWIWWLATKIGMLPFKTAQTPKSRIVERPFSVHGGFRKPSDLLLVACSFKMTDLVESTRRSFLLTQWAAKDMEVSWNRGTHKSSTIDEIFHEISHLFWGFPKGYTPLIRGFPNMAWRHGLDLGGSPRKESVAKTVLAEYEETKPATVSIPVRSNRAQAIILKTRRDGVELGMGRWYPGNYLWFIKIYFCLLKGQHVAYLWPKYSGEWHLIKFSHVFIHGPESIKLLENFKTETHVFWWYVVLQEGIACDPASHRGIVTSWDYPVPTA